MKKSRRSLGEEKKRKVGRKETFLSLLFCRDMNRARQIFLSYGASIKKLNQIEINKSMRMSSDVLSE